jgi:hypothetical protein
MKTRILKFSVFSIISLAVALSCSREKEEFNPKIEKIFFEDLSSKSFSLNNQSDLNELSKVLSNETKEIKLLKNASLVKLKDSQGQYEAISVQYRVDDFITTMIIPISEVPFDNIKMKHEKVNSGQIYYMRLAESCEMKCTSGAGCGTCTQEVTERCKKQTCSCSSSGECTGSIIFSD